MDIAVKINKLSCNHVILTYTSGDREIKRVFTVQELKQELKPDSLDEVEQMIFEQVRKIIFENPLVSVDGLKTLIEQRVFKV